VLQFAAAIILLLGGISVGVALTKGKRGLFVALGLIALLGVAAVSSIPTVRIMVRCRIGGQFWSEDAHPPELVGTWVGWDASYPTPYCRLELEADGTGRCAMWYDRGSTGLWRVSSWNVSRNRIEVSVESGERREQMKGEVSDGALSLEYFGSDGPDFTKNWFGPLHLIPEEKEAEARLAISNALEAR